MIKNISTGSWWTWDTTRGLTNAASTTESNQAWDLGGVSTEVDSIVNRTSDSFTITENATTSINTTGSKYLWVAWAA